MPRRSFLSGPTIVRLQPVTGEAAHGMATSSAEFGIDDAPVDSSGASVPNFSQAKHGTIDVDYHYESQASLNYLAGLGWKHIRIPTRGERFFTAYTASSVTLDATEVGRVSAMLDRIQTAGMRGWLDIHNYGYVYLAPNSSTAGTRYPVGGTEFGDAAFADLWGKLAANLGSHPALAGYQLMNEPRSTTGGPQNLTLAMWKSASQAAVTGIRNAETANGHPRAWIAVCGYQFGDLWDWATINGSPWITDPYGKYRYEAHWYWGGYVNTANHVNPLYGRYANEVSNASGQGYATGAYDALHTRLIGTSTSPRSELAQWDDWFVSNGMLMRDRGIVGEYGWNNDHDGVAYDAAGTRTTGSFTGDQASFNTLAGRVLSELDARRVPWLGWSCGEFYPNPPAAGYDQLTVYSASAGTLNTKQPQATTYEAHPTFTY